MIPPSFFFFFFCCIENLSPIKGLLILLHVWVMSYDYDHLNMGRDRMEIYYYMLIRTWGSIIHARGQNWVGMVDTDRAWSEGWIDGYGTGDEMNRCKELTCVANGKGIGKGLLMLDLLGPHIHIYIHIYQSNHNISQGFATC